LQLNHIQLSNSSEVIIEQATKMNKLLVVVLVLAVIGAATLSEASPMGQTGGQGQGQAGGSGQAGAGLNVGGQAGGQAGGQSSGSGQGGHGRR